VATVVVEAAVEKKETGTYPGSVNHEGVLGIR
jgi:hypothetical protein